MSGRILQNSNLIEVRQGDTFTLRMHFTSDCKDVDLSEARVRMQVRKIDDGEIVIDKLATSIDAVNGRVAIILTPTDTNIEVGEYYTDIQAEMKNGIINTFFPQDVDKVGILRITKQITR